MEGTGRDGVLCPALVRRLPARGRALAPGSRPARCYCWRGCGRARSSSCGFSSAASGRIRSCGGMRGRRTVCAVAAQELAAQPINPGHLKPLPAPSCPALAPIRLRLAAGAQLELHGCLSTGGAGGALGLRLHNRSRAGCWQAVAGAGVGGHDGIRLGLDLSGHIPVHAHRRREQPGLAERQCALRAGEQAAHARQAPVRTPAACHQLVCQALGGTDLRQAGCGYKRATGAAGLVLSGMMPATSPNPGSHSKLPLDLAAAPHPRVSHLLASHAARAAS